MAWPHADLEDQNRKLQATAEHAARDDAEIGLLVEKHQKLEAAYKDLQVGPLCWHCARALHRACCTPILAGAAPMRG